MDIEATVARILKERTHVPTFIDVPVKRPEEFISLELTGGARGFKSEADVGVKCWAKTRKRAHAIAQSVLDCTEFFAQDEANIFNTDVESVYRRDDPDSGQPRYQVNFTFTICE